MQRALAEGTQDARLFFHAAVIASQAGHAADAERWLRKARELSQLLLPSERNELQNAAACAVEKKAFQPTKTFFARNNYRAENSTPTSNQNLRNK
jgi:hypothetical protein